ncbi:hypothetical protein S7711_04479 [Stachybotrys chartarum IBT 7711]|uniref:HhH-GPD domain-containing protein n=1 Tax=Stachybotrys chartarum (strain CBS 109288 / IBT 7711) TaxID=1280523 RepID=A0A084BA62_STACB|nr:hypothetical protein S7711_04479 [Stachybotrys chartarum IBT 7711]
MTDVLAPVRRSTRIASLSSPQRRVGKIGAVHGPKSQSTTTKVAKKNASNLPAKQRSPLPPLVRPRSESSGTGERERNDQLARKKWTSWSAHAESSPFPDFKHPTKFECEEAFRVLHQMHNDAVEEEFNDPNVPATIPHVLDAIIIAILSQATSWSNAKRAMDSMKKTYGSIFAYDAILDGGREKLQNTLRCGGLHVRKSKIITTLLQEVQDRHGCWDLDHLFKLNDKEAMRELISYKYIGPKSAFVVMGWCLQRNNFTVDTHIYRIAGLWKWRPQQASREQTQAHLDALVPSELKFKLHFLLLQHGRTCPACRGGSKQTQACEARKQMSVDV